MASAAHADCPKTGRYSVKIDSAPQGAPGGGLAAFFAAAGVPAPAPVLPQPSAPDPVVLSALAHEHGIEILPPPAA